MSEFGYNPEIDESYLMQLNEQQREAVTWLDSPQLVIAGAGSGKTRVLTYKIVHLLVHGYEPWRILALTFTNKAAREMRDRIEGVVGPQVASKLWMGTFHSVFARILRINAEKIGYQPNYTIYDEADSKALIKSVLRDLGLDDKTYKVATVKNTISMAKNALMSPSDYRRDRDLMDHDRRCRRSEMVTVYELYCERCRLANAMDFDDLLFNTNVLLRDNPEVLRHYQEYFRYVLVDEYQDTNFAQHMIVSQLCRQGGGGLCVVGDDAQSIYSFRGANISNILNLEKAYPGLQVFKLEQNYRSTQNIINAANTLIAKNKDQIEKKIFSRNAEGSRIDVVQSFSDYEEAYLVASRISQMRMSTLDPYSEFAVLYRTNAQSRILEEALRKRAIPYRIYGGLSFYQRKEIKDAVAYMRMSVNPHDDEALLRIINTPSRGIGETTVRKLSAAAIGERVSVWSVVCNPENYSVGLNKGTLGKLANFRNLITSFVDANINGVDAGAMTARIIEGSGLLTAIDSDSAPENISRRENLGELLSAAKQFVDEKTEAGNSEDVFLGNFLTEVSLATDQDRDKDQSEPSVTLMTIHAAKGLEFNNVFIVGVEEDLLPSAMSKESSYQIEEERRLLYVAITRARNNCMISYAGSRYINGQTVSSMPSRFLRDIDIRYLHLCTGSDLAGGRETWQRRSQDAKNSWWKQPQNLPQSEVPAWRRKAVASASGTQRETQSSPSYSSQSGRPMQSDSSSAQGDFTVHSSSELRENMAIEHNRFGRGTILKIDTSQTDHRIVVEFMGEEKTLLLKFAKFNIIG